ncbi:MAG: outer membrane protein assembly factor BamB family protein [Limisphaerales bacterium]
MSIVRHFLPVLAGASLLASVTAETHWPQFRGPGGLGLAAEGDDFPVHFGPDTNLAWKVALPPGNSSPCVWGDRIFVTGFTDPDLETICLDRATGAVRWRKGVPADTVERGSTLGNPASPTPTADGQRVYAYFGSFGVVAYDLEGNEAWRRPLPTPVTQHGVGTSPVLAGDRLLVLRDQDVGSELLALDVADGQIVWRQERADFRRGFATPLVVGRGSETAVLVPGTLQAILYRASDGARQWSVDGLPNEVCASPAAGGGLLFVCGWTPGSGVPRMPAFDGLLQAGDADQDGRLAREEAPNGPAKQHFPYIDADKDGFLTRAEYESIASIFNRSQNALLALRVDPGGPTVAWKQTRGLPYVPSPLYYRERLHLVKNGGLVSCFRAATGEVLYQEERLGVMGDFYASPVAANGKLLMTAQPGTFVVLRAADELEVLARNPLGEPVMATPAIVGRTLLVRSQKHLWAFREGP